MIKSNTLRVIDMGSRKRLKMLNLDINTIEKIVGTTLLAGTIMDTVVITAFILVFVRFAKELDNDPFRE